MGHAELAGHGLTLGVQINTDNLVGPDHARALQHIQANTAQTKHGHIRAGPHLGRIDHSAHTRGDAAANITNLFERSVLANLGQGDFWQHGVIGKGRGAHIVQDLLALIGKAAGAVWHKALALSRADRLAKIGPARQAELTIAAFGRVERDDMIAGDQRGHAGANLENHAGALMA